MLVQILDTLPTFPHTARMTEQPQRTLTPSGEGQWTLTPRQAADQIGVSVDTVKLWADTGKIPCWRTPTNHRRFRQADIDALLAFGRQT